jgi:hypothetical protein
MHTHTVSGYVCFFVHCYCIHMCNYVCMRKYLCMYTHKGGCSTNPKRLCVCVCVHIYTYVYVSVYTDRLNECSPNHPRVHLCVYECMHVYSCVHIRACMHTYTHTYTYSNTHECMHTKMHIRSYIRTQAYIHTHTY